MHYFFLGSAGFAAGFAAGFCSGFAMTLSPPYLFVIYYITNF
jgi:hypothetical protein